MNAPTPREARHWSKVQAATGPIAERVVVDGEPIDEVLEDRIDQPGVRADVRYAVEQLLEDEANRRAVRVQGRLKHFDVELDG